MIRRTLNLGAIAAAFVLLSSHAIAADRGFYLFASAGTGDEDPETVGTLVANSLVAFRAYPESVAVDDGKSAWSAGLGYRINRYLSAELEYIDFGTTRVIEHYRVDNPGAPIPTFTVFDIAYSSQITGPALSLLGTLPIGENVELFLKGGALYSSRDYKLTSWDVDEKESETIWLAGAGVRWSFAGRWAIRAQYEQTGQIGGTFIAGETEVKRISLGVLFAL